MTVAALLIAFALVGFIAGGLWELSRPGGTVDLERRLEDARCDAARAQLRAITSRRLSVDSSRRLREITTDDGRWFA